MPVPMASGGDIFIDAQDHGTVHATFLARRPRPDGRVETMLIFDDAEMRVRGHHKTMIWERVATG